MGCHPAGESEVILSLKLGSDHMGMDQSRDRYEVKVQSSIEIVERSQFGIDEKLLKILLLGLSKVTVPKST